MEQNPITAQDLYIEPYPGLLGHERVDLGPCSRCAGRGYLVRFGHVHSGICYECNGRARTSHLVSSARSTARRQSRDQAAYMQAEAVRAEMVARLAVDYADLIASAEKVADESPFIASILASIRYGHTPTPAQVSAVTKAIASTTARLSEKADEVDVPEGRHDIEGDVLSTKEVENDYGTAHKMLVEVDGFRIWGTVPAALVGVEKGTRVRFTARLVPKERGFGFFSRPTKAARVL